MGADPTESAVLPWERRTRLSKGRVERFLEELAREHPLFRATAVRPGGILARATPRLVERLLAPIAVRVDDLAAVLADAVTAKADARFGVMSNGAIRRRSRELRDRC